MYIKKLLKSSIFHLMLTYTALFSISVGILLLFIYLSAISEMEGQIKNTIKIQLSNMKETYREDGFLAVKYSLKAMLKEKLSDMSVYMLSDAKGYIIEGNYDIWPVSLSKDNTWATFSILPKGANPEDEPVEVMASAITFHNGSRLMVGYNMAHVEKIQNVIINVLITSLGLGLIMATICGIFATKTTSRRLEALNGACSQVMYGNLSERVPVSGGGDEFDHLAENFNTMLSKIAELVENIRAVSQNIAHDLKTPLNRLRIRLENILLYKPDQAKTLHEIQSAINDVDSLVTTFNAITRISLAESGAGVDQFTICNLSDQTDSLVDFYIPLAEEKHIRLEKNIHQNITTTGDKHLLNQAMANILDNAIKYTPKNGNISVTLHTEDKWAVLSVSDTGPGIPEAYHNRVKERFFRIDSSRTVPGSGLGLSLVDAFVKLHKGELWFEDNNPGLKVVVKFLAI